MEENSAASTIPQDSRKYFDKIKLQWKEWPMVLGHRKTSFKYPRNFCFLDFGNNEPQDDSNFTGDFWTSFGGDELQEPNDNTSE